jgi:cytochrome c peroxidase
MTHDAPVDSRARTDLKRYACRIFVVLSLIWALGTVPSAGQAPQAPASSTAETVPEVQEPLVPLPLTSATDPARVALGARLFQDVRLSGRNTRACATCHQLARGGADGLPQPKAADGTFGRRNALSIFNVAFNMAYHWDGVAPTLEAQAERVLLSPAVMDTTWPKLLEKLRADPDYTAAFTATYPAGLTKANVLNAIATYERSLITPNARFDAYLRGQRQALSAEEAQGYQLFKDYGCVACHQGVNVGGNMFQKFGIFPGMMKPAPPGKEADLGRFLYTGVDRDRGVFRVPSLRNVAVTAPYFHDGRAPTLENAVDTMARVQLGRTLTREEIGLIVQFLHTLTGEYQGRSLASHAEALQ